MTYCGRLIRVPAAVLVWLALPLLARVTVAQDKPALNKPLPPAEAAATMKLPAGFTATLFAGEPDLVQPMAFTFDDRGRVWVVECLSYPTWKADGTGSDRVTIFEDSDNDGKHDKRTVFYDKGVNLSGIEVGFGGVWLTAVPNLIFIPDANADDQPDGPPKVLLDGWDLAAKHNVVGNLAWGPDGWLYGCNGILSNSRVGRPGTPDKQRVALNCGVWRYHPVRHTFEAYAHGTTNPWGLDWDERGQMFITNCVIKHLFHVVPGAHYERMFGQDINPHSYGLMQSCADHQHWAGGHWTTSRGGQGAHGDAGGGHAHSGCMIYLGDNWPKEYRGNVFTLNIHGQRLNRDTLVREGSGYVAQHAPDMIFSKDPWFRGIGVKYGPDGGVFISDWSDTGECHDYTEEDCEKSGGRIFKIVYTDADSAVGNALRGVPGSVSELSNRQLVELHTHPNEWHVRHARRVLQERAAAELLDSEVRELLSGQLGSGRARRSRQEVPPSSVDAPVLSLRAAQTLVACELLDDAALAELIEHDDPDVAGLAMLASVDGRKPSAAVLDQLAIMARQGGSKGPALRLHLASAIRRFPKSDAWQILKALLDHAGDTDDHNLPLMYWYAVEPLVAADPRQAIAMLPEVKIPLIRQYITRRLVAVHEGDGGSNGSSAWIIDELMKVVAAKDKPPRGKAELDVLDALRVDILTGLLEVYRGRRSVTAPASWPGVREELLVKRSIGPASELAGALGVVYRDPDVIRQQLSVVGSRGAPLESRVRSAELLTGLREPRVVPLLFGLLEDERFRPHAIRSMAAFEDPRIPQRLLAAYPSLPAEHRQDVIQTLTARPEFAVALLNAIESKTIDRRDVSALIIRQLQQLSDQRVSERLGKVWGDIRPASADKQQRIAEFKSRLTESELKAADLTRGRALYAKNCATCHKLFDEGSRIGPELTGSQRTSLDYLLDNVLDPSGIVPREYKAHTIRLADGRVVQGVILEEQPLMLVVQTANETVRIPTGEIENRKESGLSMMPEGLFDRLSAEEVRDLVGYLGSPNQVPLQPD
jgi:putative membrane-bound dehydrogenase-like protein